MLTEETTKIGKIGGRQSDDYHLWRLCFEIALNEEEYWNQLQSKDCNQEVKDKATAIIFAAIGDAAFRVCSIKVGNPMATFRLLDKHFASKRTATRILALTSLFAKSFRG